MLNVEPYTRAILKNKKHNYYHLPELNEEMDSDQRQAEIPLGVILDSFCHQRFTHYFCKKEDALNYGYPGK